jgi:hypothetical protein
VSISGWSVNIWRLQHNAALQPNRKKPISCLDFHSVAARFDVEWLIRRNNGQLPVTSRNAG